MTRTRHSRPFLAAIVASYASEAKTVCVFSCVDNFRVGLEAEQLLARHAQQNWAGKFPWVLGLDLAEAGPLVQSRITGAFEGVRSQIADIPVESFVRTDGCGMPELSCPGAETRVPHCHCRTRLTGQNVPPYNYVEQGHRTRATTVGNRQTVGWEGGTFKPEIVALL